MKGYIRWVLLIVLVLVIAGMSILIYKNNDNWFTSKTTILYPDGCNEKYKGTELITPECTEGRKIAEENKRNPGGYESNYGFEEIIKWNVTPVNNT